MHKARMKIDRPLPSEYHPAFERYVARVPEGDALPVLEDQLARVHATFAPLSSERAAYRYAPDKWSVLQLLGHVTDCERVFGYRALCIARGESAALPGFDENDYASNAGHDTYGLGDLLAEFEAVRRSHISLLGHLDAAAVGRVGSANGTPTSVRALAYLMAGHVRHHLAVLADKYGIRAGA
jgi:DinB superfamily